MRDPYGTIQKTIWSFLFFVVPAAAILGVGVYLLIQETGSLALSINRAEFLIYAVIAAASLIWGIVFVRKPVIDLRPEGLYWPNGRMLKWDEITSVEVGQTTTKVVSVNTGPRQVKHEVVWLWHKDGDATKIVTTWAAEGPSAANERIKSAFELSR